MGKFCNSIHAKFIECRTIINYINEFNESLNKYINDMDEKLYPQNNDEKSLNCILNFNSPSTSNSENDSFNQQNVYCGNCCDNNFQENSGYFSFINHEMGIEFNSFEFERDFKIKTINEKKEDNDNGDELKCSNCKPGKQGKAINICTHCKKYYCENCSNLVKKNEAGQNHILETIKDDLLTLELKKSKFLNDFISFFKHYLLKCNYILQLESIDELPLPLINDIKIIDSHNKYLEEINALCKNNYCEDEKNIDGKIISALQYIFKGISMDYNDIDFNSSDELYTKADEDFDKDFDKIKNKLLYFINIVSKENIELNSTIINTIVKNFCNYLSIEKDNIFILMNHEMDNFVKHNNITKINYNNFERKNHISDKSYELQLLYDDYLSHQCDIPKKFFDYRGNTLNPNSSYNLFRGTEKYYPPYGWIGIGLNVLGQYDNGNDEWLTNKTNSSEWAIAYTGLSPRNSTSLIKKLLKYIIVKKKLNIAISKINCESNDKRNWGKVGKGIYLTPNIRIAEQYTNIISFNNKTYKVLFMARVYIKGIREPENSYFWVLDEKNIRIYRILFKEKK